MELETIVEDVQLAAKKSSDSTISDTVKYEYINESKCSIETMLREYKMGKVLGQGTSGKVQLATHAVTGAEVAVKIIQKRDGLRELPLPKEELKCLRTLRHGNIVRLYSVFDTPRSLCLVMEAADTDMLSFLNTCPVWLTEMSAARFFNQVLEGVRFCHGLGVCHRDLKLENLLLVGTTLKIADFGLSKFVGLGNQLDSYAGSPQYLAPELIDEALAFDGTAADMWSCGVVMYAMLFRGLPFDDANIDLVLRNIQRGSYVHTRPITEDATALLASLLEAAPAKRASAQIALDAAWLVANADGPADQQLPGLTPSAPQGEPMTGAKALSTDTMLSSVTMRLALKRKAEAAGIRMTNTAGSHATPQIPTANLLTGGLDNSSQRESLRLRQVSPGGHSSPHLKSRFSNIPDPKAAR
ncbi:kinase-like domain-containing protein [Pavlovales sp. CCMP2436]|nr:kinase-like domain-containing protein [Pavlovales sp. CCMP2436]|mmetsp:Transcript_5146/g.13407  ORF Transcript_5146/g.13407 Transcript_5146/m.13407 type:complete len:413 (+) Transcript_5146:180-1418(+)